MPVPLVPLDVESPVVVDVMEHHRASLRPDVAAFGRRYGWRVRFDPRSGLPRFGIGRSVPGDRLDGLIADIAALADVDVASLERVDVRGTAGRSSIRFVQRHAGVPIAGAGIDVFLRRGRIQAARIDLHRVPSTVAVDGMDVVAPFLRGDELAYTGVTVSEGDGLVTWFDPTGAPVRRFTRVLEAGDVEVQNADGTPRRGARPLVDEVKRARAWLRAIDAEHPWLSPPTVVQPEALGASCRAEFRAGVLRFGAGDNTCPASWTSADLVRHEFAHGVQVASLLVDRLGPAVAEGAADYLAATASGSPILVAERGPDGLRRLDRKRTLASARSFDVHQQGLVFGSMAWNLRVAAAERDGGVKAVDTWVVDLMRYGPALDDLTELALLADDDDGDLLNGTPQDTALWAGLASHGLGAHQLGAVRLDHVPLSSQPSSADSYPVTFDLTPILPGAGTPSSVRVIVDGAEPVVVPATSKGIHHLALLPRAPVGRVVSYTIAWEDAVGQSTRVGGFTFQVGDTRPVSCDLASVDPRVDGAATVLRAEGRRNAKTRSPRATLAGREVWTADVLWDGGLVPFSVDLRAHRAQRGPLVFEPGHGTLELQDVCVVTLADPADHYRVANLRAERDILRWTVPFVEPVHAVELLVYETLPARAEGGEVLARWSEATPGAEMSAPHDGPGFYVVRVFDVDGHAFDDVVEGANLLEIVDSEHTGDTADTGWDSGDTGVPLDTGPPVDSGDLQ